MTLVYLWSRYQKDCISKSAKPYQYRQFCELYARWCRENCETLHIQAVIGQKMEVDFAGKTFELIDKLTGEITTIVVFVAVLPYSQYIYAEGMASVSYTHLDVYKRQTLRATSSSSNGSQWWYCTL